MGKKRNQSTDSSRQSDELRTDNSGTEQGNKSRHNNDLSRQNITYPDKFTGRERNESPGRTNEEPVDENSEDLP